MTNEPRQTLLDGSLEPPKPKKPRRVFQDDGQQEKQGQFWTGLDREPGQLDFIEEQDEATE